MNNFENLDCFTLEDILKKHKALLILSNSGCGNCKTWEKQLNKAIVAGNLPADVSYGVLNINQKGLMPFRSENPWVEKAVYLPYTALFIDGKFQWGFMGQEFNKLTELMATFNLYSSTHK